MIATDGKVGCKSGRGDHCLIFTPHLSSLSSVPGHFLGENLHDLRVQLGHQDFNGLVGLRIHFASDITIHGVERVKIPAVPSESNQIYCPAQLCVEV